MLATATLPAVVPAPESVLALETPLSLQIGAVSLAALREAIVAFVLQLAVFVGVTAVVAVVGRAILVPVTDRALRARDAPETLRNPARKVVRAGALLVGIAVGFAVAGFGNLLASVATLTAAATLAIGFASRDVIGNLVSGAFLIADPKFNIGDWVEWNDRRGVVEDISFRVSRVRTFDNELVTVPNATLANTEITNPVATDRLRVPITFGVGYGDDLDHAREVILDEAAAHPEILDDPEPTVRLVELGDSAIGLQARVWIGKPARSDFVRVRSEYAQAVKERCDEEGIELPYPYRQLVGDLTVDGVGTGG